ncbi:MAG: MATE family efflux transporter [Flavobacteriales bacterium]
MQENSLQLKATYKQILAIALPISASIFVPQINFITNLVFLGKLGEQVLAVAAITGVYYLIFSVIGHGLNNGLQALISRRAGENDTTAIGVLFQQGIIIGLIISLFSILFTLLVAPYIFGMVISSPERLEMTNNFLKVRIWGLPFLMLYQLRNALLVGINKSKLLVIGTAVETVFNIFFDYGLIYGELGMPQLGYMGAAYASIIAEFAGLVVIAIILQAPSIKNLVNIEFTLIPKKEVILEILEVSTPLILQFLISVISWEYFFLSIEHYGERDLAISNLMRTIFGFFGCFTWAFASTANTLVSNVIGQNRHDLVFDVIKKIIHLSLLFAIVMFVLLNIFPKAFFSIFGQGELFLSDALPVVRVVSSALILMSFSVVWLNAVIGTGNTRISLIAEVLAIILYCLFVYFVLNKWKMPITVGWFSEWVYWLTLFIVSWIYMKKGNWKLKKI